MERQIFSFKLELLLIVMKGKRKREKGMEKKIQALKISRKNSNRSRD